MNGHVATYTSGMYLSPHTDKSNLRLDLNLMNLNMTNNISTTPCTPNGKIKVYMNNIASNVTKIKNASNERKEWRRCKFDKHDCISLDDVLQTFNSSISEEQAWSICFSFIKCIRKLIKKGFKFKNQSIKTSNSTNLNNFVIYLHKDGYVHERTIFQLINHGQVHKLNGFDDQNNKSNGLNGHDENENDFSGSHNSNDNQLNHELDNELNIFINGDLTNELNEQELLMRLGLAVFDALDFRKDSNEELLISAELENLIAKITLEEADGNITFTIDEIYDICCSRKASQNEDKIDEFYTSICRTLVIETIELSTFLQTIYEGTQMREKIFNNNSNNKQDCTDSSLDKLSNDDPLKFHLAQWAKLWMQVLEEFRSGKRKLRKVETPKPTIPNTITNHSDLNAHTLIMEYIRSRPALMPANNRKLGPLKESPQSLIEQIHDQIRKQDIKLKPVNHDRDRLFAPVVGRVVDNRRGSSNEHLLMINKQLCNSENNSPMIKRKLIKADIDSFMDDRDDFTGKMYSSLF